MPATIVLGGQWGDEGKGKITDALAARAQIVVRANGGSNAGHTITTADGVFKMHLVPSGILNSDCLCVIGAGVVVDPSALVTELTQLQSRGIDTSRLLISDKAHAVLPFHSVIDSLEETAREDQHIGTTLKGIGPAYADKYSRRGIRMVELLSPATIESSVAPMIRARNDLLVRYYGADEIDVASAVAELVAAGEQLRPYIGAAEQVIQDSLDGGAEVIIECAQGAMLDIDYGTYPYVTSSSPTAAGACQGAGVAPNQVERVIGVFKAYCTRVGEGPMPTEMCNETSDLIRERGREYGTTTGRPRRIGWFDAVAARQVVRLNGVTEIAVTLLDVLDTLDPLHLCASYLLDGRDIGVVPSRASDLARCDPVLIEVAGWHESSAGARLVSEMPDGALAYLDKIEALAGAPVTMAGVGPDRDQLVLTAGRAGTKRTSIGSGSPSLT